MPKTNIMSTKQLSLNWSVFCEHFKPFERTLARQV